MHWWNSAKGVGRNRIPRATTAELYAGLTARSQNRWPSLAFDMMAVNSLAAPIFAAGFYHKTFMWPASFWENIYEPMIRRAAGVGTCRHRGRSGPLRESASVLRCAGDRCRTGRVVSRADPRAGPGLAWRSSTKAPPKAAACCPNGKTSAARRRSTGFARLRDELASMANVTLLPRTTLFGVFDHGSYGAIERVADHFPSPPPGLVRQRYWKIVARRCVLAAGGDRGGRSPLVAMIARASHVRGCGAQLCQPLGGVAGAARRGVHRWR